MNGMMLVVGQECDKLLLFPYCIKTLAVQRLLVELPNLSLSYRSTLNARKLEASLDEDFLKV